MITVSLAQFQICNKNDFSQLEMKIGISICDWLTRTQLIVTKGKADGMSPDIIQMLGRGASSQPSLNIHFHSPVLQHALHGLLCLVLIDPKLVGGTFTSHG